MRLGLLADVHANLPALEVALAALARQGVDRVLVAGDLVGYGPHPNECIGRLAEVGAVCVAGNHDLFTLDRLPPDRFAAMARHSHVLTRRVLGADERAFLDALPTEVRVGHVVMTHGALDDPEEYVRRPDRARELLGVAARRWPGATTLVLGHTHVPWFVTDERAERRPTTEADGAPRVVNPGSVGQSRVREPAPRTRFAVLDTTTGTVAFDRRPYPVGDTRADLRTWGLPDRCVHSPPRRGSGAVAVARQVRRRLLA